MWIHNIYLPGYREENIPKQPGFEIEKFCRNTHRKFTRIILPGEAHDKSWRSFSATATKEVLWEYIEELQEPTIISVYSRSCRDVIDYLLQADEKTLQLIEQINLVHPNIDSLYSIKVMDWATSNITSLKDDDVYLYWDYSEAYKNLMKPVWKDKEWRWDPKQFQQDLFNAHLEDKDGYWLLYKVQKLRNKQISCNIFLEERDKIVNPAQELKLNDLGKIQALASHRPKKSTFNFLYEAIEKIA